MANEQITFDKLPQAVGYLTEQMEQIRYKKGKKLYFYEDELLQWIESGRKQMQAMSLQEQAAEIVHGAKRKPKGGYNF